VSAKYFFILGQLSQEM